MGRGREVGGGEGGGVINIGMDYVEARVHVLLVEGSQGYKACIVI